MTCHLYLAFGQTWQQVPLQVKVCPGLSSQHAEGMYRHLTTYCFSSNRARPGKIVTRVSIQHAASDYPPKERNYKIILKQFLVSYIVSITLDLLLMPEGVSKK